MNKMTNRPRIAALILVILILADTVCILAALFVGSMSVFTVCGTLLILLIVISTVFMKRLREAYPLPEDDNNKPES